MNEQETKQEWVPWHVVKVLPRYKSLDPSWTFICACGATEPMELWEKDPEQNEELYSKHYDHLISPRASEHVADHADVQRYRTALEKIANDRGGRDVVAKAIARSALSGEEKKP